MQYQAARGDEARSASPEGVPFVLDASVEALIECMPHGVLLLDREARIVALNDALLSLIDEPREGLVGQPLRCLFAEWSDGLERRVVAMPSGSRMGREECTLRTRQRSSLPVQLTVAELSLARASAEHRELAAPERVVVVTVLDGFAPAHNLVGKRAEPPVRELVEALPQLVNTCLPDGRCDTVNQRWLEFTGQAEHELLGAGWLEWVHPDERDPLRALMEEASRGRSDWALELRLRRRDDMYRWFDMRAVPLLSGSGEVLKWLAASTDVHDGHELRERLRSERARLATIVDNAPVVVISFERDGDGQTRFSFVSASAHELYGYEPAQIQADSALVFSRVHADDLEHLLASIEASAREGEPLGCAFRYLHPSRGERWLEAQSRPYYGPGGTIVWSGLVSDITVRKQIEVELKLTRAQLESALEAAEMGAWLWDYESNMLWGSESMRRMWQVPSDCPAWFDPQLIAQRIDPGDLVRMLSESAESVATGQRLETEYRILVPDRGERWIASRARVELSPDGRNHRLAGINLDVTHQKLGLESALRSQKLEALGTLAGGIAHDFNNVLFAISGYVSLSLGALAPDDPVRAYLEQIAKASTRATELVRQILAFSRPQDQKLEVIRLANPVQDALRLVRSTIPMSIEIHADLDEKAPAALIDSARVVQVIVNLCANAAHAIGKDRAGSIDVRLQPVTLDASGSLRVPAGSYAMLSVRDDGCGMNQATQARIFDPFFTTKLPGEGTGLGLSVVHGIVQALGAHLTVWSEVGQGTLFRIYFPAMPEAPPARDEALQPAARGDGRRVLFVDDEGMLVMLGKSFLELLGYRASAFQDPHEALAAFRREPTAFAAVVTDLSMPALSGFDVVRSVREVRPDVPVLMMSGYLGPQERTTAEQLQITEIALKPLSIEQLAEHLERLCQGAAAQLQS